MKSKSILIIALAAILTLFVVYTALYEDNTMFDDLKTANENYDIANAVDYEAQKIESNRLKSEIEYVESEITVLQANIKNIEAEHAQKVIELRLEKTKEISEKATALRSQITELNHKIDMAEDEKVDDELYLDSSSDVIYSLLLNSTDKTAVDIVTYFAQYADNGLYTVKFVGYIDALSSVMDRLTINGERYNISIGNFSLRQIYNCYDNMRPWDKTSLLDWFDNKYVSGSGGVGSIEGGYIIDGIKLSGLIGQETVEALKQAKLEAIQENKLKYDAIIANIETERMNSIKEAYNALQDGVDIEKVEALVLSLHEYYDKKVDNTKQECLDVENAIIKDFDERIAAISKTPSDEEFNLANPDLLIYTLDITFAVHSDNGNAIPDIPDVDNGNRPGGITVAPGGNTEGGWGELVTG